MRWRAILLVAAALGLSGAAEPAPDVTVTGGTVVGMRSDDGALVFRGIPYAAPPLGERRWRAPAPVVPWQGPRAATGKAPACLQNDYGWNRGDYLHSAEDCLTLDIRTPALRGRLPVMVWIHGGSNRAGSARGRLIRASRRVAWCWWRSSTGSASSVSCRIAALRRRQAAAPAITG
jgi:para-nitrobenzyl esterase